MPVTRAFSDEAETYRAPGAIGRGAVEDQPLEAAAPTVPMKRRRSIAMLKPSVAAVSARLRADDNCTPMFLALTTARPAAVKGMRIGISRNYTLFVWVFAN